MKRIFVLLIMLGINYCYASDYYCGASGIIVNTNITAESYCKPFLDSINNAKNYSSSNYERAKRMYQSCLKDYRNAKAEMQNGRCKQATKHITNGYCGEIITEYFVSGHSVSSSSRGGNVACLKKQANEKQLKMMKEYGN